MAKVRPVPKAHRESIEAAQRALRDHPLLRWLPGDIRIMGADGGFARDGFARIMVWQESWPTLSPISGQSHRRHRFTIDLNGFQRCDWEEWLHVMAQARLHIVLNHCDLVRRDVPWRIACELEAMDLVRNISIGRRPAALLQAEVALPARGLQEMAQAIAEGGEKAIAMFDGFGLGGKGQPSWQFSRNTVAVTDEQKKEHTDLLAHAIRSNIAAAVENAGASARSSGPQRAGPNTMAEQARRWFVANYPLLASLAAAFEIIEDTNACRQLDIAVAAVDAEQRRIYINPNFPWTRPAMDFVIAHELLHVGLRHDERRQGRDPFLWNIACDYVINGWLQHMGIGTFPTDDLMLDPELALDRDSAEAVYDRIVRDRRRLRKIRKLRTLRGIAACDIISDRSSGWWTGPGTDLDSFYRRALAGGLDLHLKGEGRGLLPGALVEEIRALQQPPIPWDVKLGQWMDAYFPPLESRRSFSRASRRQGATPDIPRPVHIRPDELLSTRTFGVVLDTSGSMPPRLLGYALGAIASYALSREVPLVRVVQCDAGVHDMGYVEPEELTGRVQVRGRGGTVLMPAIRLLQESANFPDEAPVLIITDGLCDDLTIRPDHAFLMPEGARLPFHTRSPIFHFDHRD